ncbi:MAG: alpha-ketoglutaric semialdehyde dehydrogenase [Pirellulaceae bacterium]|jgi:alpha-ketoglutaric semialdehyde dehydrogenase
MSSQPVLINGAWREAKATGTFQADNPTTREPLNEVYPISNWEDCEEALNAAFDASVAMRNMPGAQVADFLEAYAVEIEARKDDLVEMAHAETGYPKSPRLADGELPRTTGQLRQAAAAARDGSWSQATIDTAAGIRSCYAAIGPVCVFGPNNFPFAFGSISGGDFAAAIAAGNPVIAKANSSHPGTTRIFAEAAQKAADATGMPKATVQLIYRLGHSDGERLVADPRVGATGYTGSRSAGLKLKAAADVAGKPMYLELSSVNPVVILPGALAERAEDIAGEFTGSCLMGTGQFCTNPGLVVLLAGEQTEQFIESLSTKFAAAPVGTLLSKGVEQSLGENLKVLQRAGAQLVVGDTAGGGHGFSHANTLLRATAQQFIESPEALQTEAFGNCSLIVVADSVDQVCEAIDHLEGNLTGCVYSDTAGSDDEAYDAVALHLRPRVGRLLNDKMPTGVAISAAMNHGGPFPATGHPGFTAVGIPGSLLRFSMLQCFDSIRPHRLPAGLQDKNPTGSMWRSVDGQWSQADIG